jgi:hypothetical protein
MIHVVDKTGAVVFQLYTDFSVKVNLEDCPNLLSSLRSSEGVMLFRYPKVSKEWLVFENKGRKMDLGREYLRSVNEALEAVDVKSILVCPSTVEVPDDGMLNFVRIANVFDLRDVPSQSVVQFDHMQHDMLKLICDNAAVMNLEVRLLVGLPEAEYTADFDSVTWQLERIAYAPFLTDLRLAKELGKQLEEESATAYAVERRTVERSDGSVKVHDADLAKPSNGDDELDGDEETA